MWRNFVGIPRALRSWSHNVRTTPTSVCHEEEAGEVTRPTVKDLVPHVFQPVTNRSRGNGCQGGHSEWERHGRDFRFEDFWTRHCAQAAIGWGTAIIVGLQVSQFLHIKQKQTRRLSGGTEHDCPLQEALYRLARALPGGHSLGQYVRELPTGFCPSSRQHGEGASKETERWRKLDIGTPVFDTGQPVLDTGQSDQDTTNSAHRDQFNPRTGHLQRDAVLLYTDYHQRFYDLHQWVESVQHEWKHEGRDHLEADRTDSRSGLLLEADSYIIPAQYEPEPTEDHLTSSPVELPARLQLESNVLTSTGNLSQPQMVPFADQQPELLTSHRAADLCETVDSSHPESPDCQPSVGDPSLLSNHAPFEAAINDWKALADKFTSLIDLNKGCDLASSGDMLSAVVQWNKLCSGSAVAANAHFNLALCYQLGCGVTMDIHEAMEHYRKSAAAGHATAAYNLACLYLDGAGGADVAMDVPLQYLKTAADLGVVQAQRELGVLYTEEDSQNLEEAVRYFSLAASQQDAAGQYYLGICCEQGWGVERNECRAASLYSNAAKAGHAEAQYNLAIFFENGLGGLPEDLETAQELYEAALDGGILAAKDSISRIEKQQQAQQLKLEQDELQCHHRGLLLSRQQSRSSPTFSQNEGSPPPVSQSLMSLKDYLCEHLQQLSLWDLEPLDTPPEQNHTQSPVKFFIGGSGDDGKSPGLTTGSLDTMEDIEYGYNLPHSSSLQDMALVPCQ